MTSEDIKITVVEPQPSMPLYWAEWERDERPLVMMASAPKMITDFNSRSKKRKTSKKSSAASSSTGKPLSIEDSWSIPKVPYVLCDVKPKAYEPNTISIGPYHYGKERLRAMDDIKRSSFANIVEITNLTLEEFVHQMKPLKERVLNCYERPTHDDLELDDKFIEMMIFDGCFIVQLIRDMCPPELAELSRHIEVEMYYDLLLLENQLPFFVLLELDRIIMRNSPEDFDGFDSSAISFFHVGMHGTEIWSGSGASPSPPKDIKHLLDMVHKCCCPSPQGIEQHQKYKTKEAQGLKRRKFIRRVSELDNVGIDFVGEKVTNSLFDVTFTEYTAIMGLKIHNKVLKIPTLSVEDSTERMLRNLMAYEQFIPINEPTYVTNYAVFMSNLVNTGKDVQLLCSAGVIDNWLGNDEAVAQMFNKIGDSICFSEDSYYNEIYDKVEKHCKGRWNTYRAKLKKGYFNSPWSVVSFLAAVILLVATVLQTAYAVISYHHPT